jgi:hypothetical protein
VDRPPADEAVQHQTFELAFEISLHRQELGAEHLDADDDPGRPVEAGLHRLVDDRVRGRRLLGDAADRSFEDLALP